MECEHCGMTYEKFRTGATFGEVAQMLWVDNPDPSTWRQKTRHTVLGFWRELKLRMWDEHKALCEEAAGHPCTGGEITYAIGQY